jgi:predicted DNA-binding protein (MmcQ/YjbR family)
MSLVDRVRRTCAGYVGATVDNVFGDDIDVFRVASKMFALVGERWVTLKSTPEESEALRATYEWIQPGYHMNKRHWITVELDQRADPTEVEELIEESYRLVVNGLPKHQRPTSPTE